MGNDSLDDKVVEEILQRSEKPYQLLADNVKDLIWTTDIESWKGDYRGIKLTYISPSVYDLSGFTVDEVMQFPLDLLMTRTSFRKVIELFEREEENIKNGTVKPQTLDIIIPHKDGRLVWTESTISVIYKDRKPMSILGVTRDITSRKKREDLLPLSVVEIDIHDKDLPIVYVNKDALERFGYTRKEVYEGEGVKSVDLVHLEDREKLFSRILARLRGDTNLGIEKYRFKVKGDIYRTFQVNADPILDERGNPIRVLAVLDDITELLEEREEVESLNKELEKVNRQLEEEVEEVMDLNEQLQILNDKLRLKANELYEAYQIDDRTGLMSIDHFKDHTYPSLMERTIDGKTEGNQHNLAIIMCDIDDFNLINALFGHKGGNYILQRVGEVLNTVPKRGAEKIRYGGEEFLIISPFIKPKEMYFLAEKIREEILKIEITIGDMEQYMTKKKKEELKARMKASGMEYNLDTKLRLTMSFGVCTTHHLSVEGLDENDPLSITQPADDALYKAKAIGKNATVLYDLDKFFYFNLNKFREENKVERPKKGKKNIYSKPIITKFEEISDDVSYEKKIPPITEILEEAQDYFPMIKKK